MYCRFSEIVKMKVKILQIFNLKYYVSVKGAKMSEWYAKQIVIDGKKYGYNSDEFKKHRSKTFDGIANAMAVQWSSYACS